MFKKKHGMWGTRLYNIWKNMKARCYGKYSTHYERYGGRGITVCLEWRTSFDNFQDWAINSGYREDLTIDRKEIDGNYTKENCRWIPNTENVRLMTEHHKEAKTGGYSKEANLKTKLTNRKIYGIPIVMSKENETDLAFNSLGEAADYFSTILKRERVSVYSHLKFCKRTGGKIDGWSVKTNT